MRHCRTCGRVYKDDSLNFCLDDGTLLSTNLDPQATLHLSPSHKSEQPPTEVLPSKEDPKIQPQESPIQKHKSRIWIIVSMLILLLGSISIIGFMYSRWTDSKVDTNNNVNNSSMVGLEGIVTVRVYLRPDPSRNNSPLAIIEKGTIVKIRSVKDDWYEVVILQDGREQQDANNTGWIISKAIDIR